MLVIQSVFCACHVSHLLSSFADPEQCRQSMASMVLEGMHMAAMCLSKLFRDGLNGCPILWAKFYLFVCTCILGTWIVVQWNCGCCLYPAYASFKKGFT